MERHAAGGGIAGTAVALTAAEMALTGIELSMKRAAPTGIRLRHQIFQKAGA